MQGQYGAVVESPVGWLGIRCEGAVLTDLEILARRPVGARPVAPGARAVVDALRAYFRGDLGALDRLPVNPSGTPFQRRVWQRLREIPAGRTLSYGVLARELGTSARAVGGACRANPVPLAIPCHRVVAATGLGGYSGARGGDWLEKKRWLLRHEEAAP
ncbi:MAG: methylated-DNA--[protein]-cysteine S-methyltransferase [Gammaproteobacteria bacterium]|jgi:methylated-DNA-[protein]-cysteine S-methyltransferase|nr:methylated-DNA--[protein]-cysteine S-methyltransferase [Gammaproteobacteria bacterium]